MWDGVSGEGESFWLRWDQAMLRNLVRSSVLLQFPWSMGHFRHPCRYMNNAWESQLFRPDPLSKKKPLTEITAILFWSHVPCEEAKRTVATVSSGAWAVKRVQDFSLKEALTYLGERNDCPPIVVAWEQVACENHPVDPLENTDVARHGCSQL